ncbi:MAG: hypothetical protein ACOC2W_00625 [bacterium]
MMTVKIIFSENSPFYKQGIKSDTIENVDEIHYRYNNKNRIAFECPDGSGVTHNINHIKEFEAIS